MKKFILPSLCAFTLLFSCNNDDDSSSNASIVGTWNYVKYQTQFSKDNHIEDEDIANECTKQDEYTFSSDNKYSAIGHDDFGGSCTIDWRENGTYQISGKTIRIEYAPNDFDEAEIISLTDHELILKSDYGEDLDGDGKNEIDLLILKR